MAKKERSIADLTGYATLLGESFTAKVNLLSQIIKEAHYPSVGRYKERLLAKTIYEYIPRSFDVGSGFVLFPTKPDLKSIKNPDFDPLNMGSHILSRQCDIIVYDSSSYPVVFKDDDFIIVRPESVKSVIEVKGAISPSQMKSILENCFDFANKWRECQLFYKSHHQDVVPKPTLFALAWSIYKDTRGRLSTNGSKLRKQVADFYKSNINPDELSGFPVLEMMLVYNEFKISNCGWSDKMDGRFVLKQGFYTTDGRFMRFDQNGEPYRGGDRTIASLLAGIHWNLGPTFNRFFSYMEETRSDGYLNFDHAGFDFWIENNDKAIKAHNKDVPI
jgi:hypothetical protein